MASYLATNTLLLTELIIDKFPAGSGLQLSSTQIGERWGSRCEPAEDSYTKPRSPDRGDLFVEIHSKEKKSSVGAACI